MLITDFSSHKALTGIDFNAGINKSVEIETAYLNINPEKSAVRFKVSNLKYLKISLNNFLTVDERTIKEQYISRFKADSSVSVWVGEDSVFNTLTELSDTDPEADLITAGLVKLSNVTFNDNSRGESFNIFSDYKREIPIDLASVKTEAGIISEDISVFILFKFGGLVYFLNPSVSKLEYTFNFQIEGNFFFELTSEGYLKESNAIEAGFIKFIDLIDSGFLDSSSFETLAANIKINGVQAVGTAETIARADHVHPTDTTREAAFNKNTAFNKNYETVASQIKINGVQAVGIAETIARADHVHPTDTTREAAFTKNTAFNKNFETVATNIKMNGEQAVGTSANVARADHVHPTDTNLLNESRAVTAGFIKDHKVYAGSDMNNVTFPIGSTLMVASTAAIYYLNQSVAIGFTSGSPYQFITAALSPNVYLAGTWRSRGMTTGLYNFERVA